MATLSEALTAYRICAQAEGKSPQTLRWVRSSVTYFSDFLGPDKQDIDDITGNDLRQFIIARIEGVSKKAAHSMLLDSRTSRYMGELIKRHIENKRRNNEMAEDAVKIATLKGIRIARKYLAEHGFSEYRSKKGGL